MFGTLNDAQIEKLLTDNYIGRIGCHANGRTYIVPISYAYHRDCVYAHTYEGLKMEMMRENPKVCFEVENLNDLANWQTVIAWGDFKELTDVDEKQFAIQKLMQRNLPKITSETVKLSNQWPFVPEDISEVDGVIFRIHLKEKTGRFEGAATKTK